MTLATETSETEKLIGIVLVAAVIVCLSVAVFYAANYNGNLVFGSIYYSGRTLTVTIRNTGYQTVTLDRVYIQMAGTGMTTGQYQSYSADLGYNQTFRINWDVNLTSGDYYLRAVDLRGNHYDSDNFSFFVFARYLEPNNSSGGS
jgi:hypothetical protein